MTIGELKEILNKYHDDMEVLIEGALCDGFSIEEVKYDCGRDAETGRLSKEFVYLYSPYIVNTLEDALGEDL